MKRLVGMMLSCALWVAVFAAQAAAQSSLTDAAGVLVLAHGGSPAWNENVQAITTSVNRTMPAEVAFGMATRANIQGAIDRLVSRGVTRIVAVPLFVSSHSTVITSTEYLLGLRKDMPPDLVRFAKMSHGHADAHAGHGGATAEDGTSPVISPVPLSMTPALDAHPLVTAIVGSRASAISHEPAREAVILVAHGPVDEATNERWLVNLRLIAGELQKSGGFRGVDALTVRDDAPAPIRDEASAALRALVERRSKEARVLVVPVLLSFGGIEEGIRKRMTGLDYTMSAQALAPDDRLVTWILETAKGRQESPGVFRPRALISRD